MKLDNVNAGLVMELKADAAVKLVPGASEVDDTFGERITPGDLRQWLARLRLLENVPFAYLVPDSALLPPESIRFFYLDRAWTDALVAGALSVGTVNSSDRAELEQLHRSIRDELDEEERLVRMPGSEEAQQGPAGTVTGFLLRSRAVSGWPGLHVRAYREELERDDEIVPESHPSRLKLLRLERLAPAVLLALFDGIPAIVHIEEPRRGIQFGIRLEPSGDPPTTFAPWIPPRDTQDPQKVINAKVPVPCRPGSPGVLDFKHLNAALVARADTHMGGGVDSAEFALEALRFPFRQVFGDVHNPVAHLADVFRPTVSIKAVAGEKTVSLTERFLRGLA
jgi:hypothetical protein